MSSGMFARLVAGDLPDKGRRWPSDESDTARVFVVSGCTGAFTTTSKRFAADTPLPEGHAEKEAALKAQAQAKLDQFIKR